MATTWPARAFGVELAVGFDAPALRQCRVHATDDPTTLELMPMAKLGSAWHDGEVERLAHMPDGRGGVLVEICEHPRLGVLVDAGEQGRYLIGPDARHVACAPPDAPAWRWQRLLVGQVLPLVAALRGVHVIHASAVSLGDHVIALAGAAGAGKSTLALELARRGHELVAEDVLSVRLDGERVLAEPGVSLVNLRPGDGASHKVQLEAPRAARAMPLSALCLLERVGAGSAQPAVEPLPAPSPRDLIATTFVPYLTRPEDLRRHLEVGAAIGRTAAVARVRVAPDADPAALAGEIEAHAAEITPRRRGAAGASFGDPRPSGRRASCP
jgi:hypothetical protein